MTTPQITVPSSMPDPLQPQPDFDATFYAALLELLTAMGQQNTMATWMNTTAGTVATNLSASITKAAEAVAAQIAAESARDLAATATGLDAWVSGGSYSTGDHRWSLINFKAFRAITDHSGSTVDPLEDAVNWIAAVPEGVGPGAIIASYTALSDPWLPCDGSVYASSAYPLLADVLGGSWPYEFGNALTPASDLSGDGYSVAINSDGDLIILTDTNSPYVGFYDFDGTTLTKQSNPAALPTGTGRRVAISPDGAFVAIAHDASPYVTFYDLATPTAPVKLSNPSVLPDGNGYWVSWSADSRFCYVAASSTGAGRFRIYDFDLGTPASVGGADTLLAGVLRCAEVSPDGNYLVISGNTSPYIAFYDLTTPNTPAKMTDPAVMPTSPSTGIDSVVWSPDSRYVMVGDTNANNAALVYDMGSGVPVSASNPDEIVCQYGAYWYQSDRFITFRAGNIQVCKVENGAFSIEQEFSRTHIFDGQTVRQIVASSDGAKVLAGTSNGFRYFNRAFDPATQFVAPDMDADSSRFDTTNAGGNTGLPTKLYIKGA